MPDDTERGLEEQIMEHFYDGMADDPEVSKEILEIVRKLADEEDFGGRDQLVERVLEVRDIDAD